MIFPQPLLLISILTLIRSSLSNFTHYIPPDDAPVHDGQIAAPKPVPIPQSGNSTNSTANQTSANHNSTSHRGAGDRCGPYSDSNYQLNQTDFETTLNTCGDINTTFTHAPSIYGVQCLNANPSWHQSIDVTSCASNAQDLCGTVAYGSVPESQWSWSSGVCIISIFFCLFTPIVVLASPVPPERHQTQG